MSDPIPAKDLLSAAKEFTVPMIKIIRPKIVICLGKITFDAISKACGQPVVSLIEKGISSPFAYCGAEIFIDVAVLFEGKGQGYEQNQ